MITDFDTFERELSQSQTAVYQALYRRNPGLIRIKKEHVAVPNLARIIESTLRLTRRKGFHAMSLRDLSADCGLSIGGLYAYIRNKDDLVALIQDHGILLTRHTLARYAGMAASPEHRIQATIEAHIYLSELLQPWFYFSFMETRHLPPPHKEAAIAMEQEVETLLRDIIDDGMRTRDFRAVDSGLLAALCKAMMQDWYLKRRKYRQHHIEAPRYAEFVNDVLRRYLIP